MRRLGIGLAVIIGAAVLAVGWYASRDPLAALPIAESLTATAPDTTRRSDRIVIRQILDDPSLGRIAMTVSLPESVTSSRPLPVVAVIGGLAGGAETLDYIPEPGANALIGYDWPIPSYLPEHAGMILEAPALTRAILTVPGQIAAGIDWAARQPWADPERISLLAFSLGALAAPATQRVAAQSGRTIGWTVLAYGGAGLGDLLTHHPRLEPDWVKPMLARTADVLLGPVEPAAHLPHLAGRFLVISGETDRFVPTAAAAALETLTPHPKTIVRLPGDHMGVGPDQRVLLATIIGTSRTWLIREGAINPR